MLKLKPWLAIYSLIILVSALSGCATKVPYSKPGQHSTKSNPKHLATVPHRLSSQEDTLIANLTQHKAQVIHEAQQLRVIMPDNANFKDNSAILPSNLMGILDYIASILQLHPYSIAKVHPIANQQELAGRRGHAIITYLESQGIPGNRLSITESGSSNDSIEIIIEEG